MKVVTQGGGGRQEVLLASGPQAGKVLTAPGVGLESQTGTLVMFQATQKAASC